MARFPKDRPKQKCLFVWQNLASLTPDTSCPAVAMPIHADLDRPHTVEGTYATKTTRTGSTPKNAPKLAVSLLASGFLGGIGSAQEIQQGFALRARHVARQDKAAFFVESMGHAVPVDG